MDNSNKEKTYHQKYYEKNREKIIARSLTRYYADRESALIRQKTPAYREKNLAWQAANQDKIIAWREANKDKIRIWLEANREKVNAYSRNKTRRIRAMRKGIGYEPYTEYQVLELYGTDCHICGKPIDMKAPRRCGLTNWEYGLQIDHVIPLSKEGQDTLKNVRPSHGICNLRKGSKTYPQDMDTL